MIKRELSLMIWAFTKAFFNKAHDNSRILLRRLDERSAEAEKTLEDRDYQNVNKDSAPFTEYNMNGADIHS